MATKIWTTKEDFDSGSLNNVVDHRNNDLQLVYAWSFGGDLNEAKYSMAGAGTQTAGLCFGGDKDGNDALITTEEYVGSLWACAGDLNTGRRNLSGCGTQTAALSIGGRTTIDEVITEEYDGTSWACAGDLNVARFWMGGVGTLTAGICFGGRNGVPTNFDSTEEYNGTSWCSGNGLSVIKFGVGGAGTQTAALCFGGRNIASYATTEYYNGTSWSLDSDLNKARDRLGGTGTQSVALSFGGYDGVTYLANTEEYNGSIWTVASSLNVLRYLSMGAGTQEALCAGGSAAVGFRLESTEEYCPVASGTWTVDFDSGYNLSVWGSTKWDDLSWLNAGGGSCKARVKSATTQGGLVGATWYPTGGSGYYETQPVDVECPDNRWYRLEVTLIEGSTPQIEQVGQDYSPPLPTIIGNANIQTYIFYTIGANGRIQPVITANSEISLNVPLYANGRIQPIINADGRISPVISANGEIVGNVPLYAVARIQPCINADGRIRSVLPAVGRIQPIISGDGRICPIIIANGRILYMITASGRISPIITATAVIFPSIRASGRIQPTISSNAEICLNVPLYAVARIQPVITGNGRIQLITTASARIAPSIGGNAEIALNVSLYANGRIRLPNYSSYTINALGRIIAERRTKLFISSDVKENILLYQRYQDLRGLVVDENFYTRDGYVVPRKRGRTNLGKYLFALQSPFFAQTVWSVNLNSSYQFDILTDAVGIAPFRMALARGENRIDVTRKETKVELLEIHPTTRTNITPFAKTASMIQKETFVIKDVSGQKTRLLDSEYSFVNTSYIKIVSSAYDASAIYTIYYVVINPGESEPEKRTYTSWVRSLNYVTWFGAYSEELMSIDDSSDETKDDTYLKTATHQSLIDNFGATLARTEPDSKWTVDGYREILEEYYHSYLRSSTTQKGVKDGIGNIVTIPPKLESYQNYKKWILGWQWLPTRELNVNPISGFPDGWVISGGTCEDSNNKLFGNNALKITVSSGATEVIIESNAISTWKRFINRNWRLRGWLCKESGPTLGIKLGISEDGGNSWNWNSQTLTSTYKRFTFSRHVSKYATNIRIRFKITGPIAGKIIYLNWPSLEEMRDKCLHVGSSSYYPETMNYIPATYVNAYTFTVGGNRVAEFTYLRDVCANCGVDDIKYGKVSQSSYVVATDITTVLLTTSILTSNLTDVKFTVNPVYWSTVPRSKAKSYHGFRVFCWGIHTLTEQEKRLVGFVSSGGINVMNPGTGHPFYIKSAEAILELVEEDDYRIYSSYDNLKAGQKTNMEVVKREDIV